jgi:hypothetical protein
MTVNRLTSAAREGCRLAVVTGPDVAAVTARATTVCNSAGVVPTSVTCVGPLSNDPDRRVTVTVEADFEVIPGRILEYFGGDGLSGTIPLRAESVMRHESL